MWDLLSGLSKNILKLNKFIDAVIKVCINKQNPIKYIELLVETSYRSLLSGGTISQKY